jgi:hypothetical protein
LRHLDLCSNKIGNDGLNLLKKYIAGVMLGKSELRHLSLYDNELEGQAAIEDIKEIMQMLTKLEFIDIDGNMMYMLDLIAL